MLILWRKFILWIHMVERIQNLPKDQSPLLDRQIMLCKTLHKQAPCLSTKYFQSWKLHLTGPIISMKPTFTLFLVKVLILRLQCIRPMSTSLWLSIINSRLVLLSSEPLRQITEPLPSVALVAHLFPRLNHSSSFKKPNLLPEGTC